MTNKLDIETRVDRSLQTQLKAPRLDGRFDSAVWERIAAQEQRPTNPVQERSMSSAARWLFVVNIIGVAVTALLVVIFGLHSFTDASVNLNLPTPEVSAATGDQILKIAAQAITLVSVIFGLLFTPLGRRLRAELT